MDKYKESSAVAENTIKNLLTNQNFQPLEICHKFYVQLGNCTLYRSEIQV